jgi:hypothetical protein
MLLHFLDKLLNLIIGLAVELKDVEEKLAEIEYVKLYI